VSNAPIGVFDSGLGGLTVARALRTLMPTESIAYFGDTARLPYGTKSPSTVYRFSKQCLKFLMSMRPKVLVVACNTASALALDSLRSDFDVPVIGVLKPGAQAAVNIIRGQTKLSAALSTSGVTTGANEAPPTPGRIGLIATEATIASNAYPAAVRELDPSLQVIGRACPLLVPLIEEGREQSDLIVGLALREYLEPFLALNVTALILGCTHYPLFADAIQETLGDNVELVDSAAQTALVVSRQLDTMNARSTHPAHHRGKLTCYVTDQGQRFERLATRFLGESVGQPIWVTPEMLEAAEGGAKA
jgi:glutamate racemase